MFIRLTDHFSVLTGLDTLTTTEPLKLQQ